MENSKSVELMNDELHLPESVIQHIQSFLTTKEAASTVVLSKSWYNSWLTRPKVDFDERDFGKYNSSAPSEIDFVKFVNRSLERYLELKIVPEGVKLCMNVTDAGSNPEARELIVQALRLGAPDLEIETHPPISSYVLPVEVFEAPRLVNLSAFGCKIGSGFGEDKVFSRIKSIKFYKVQIEESDFRGLVSKCPLLESLFLCNCEGLEKVEVKLIRRLTKLGIVHRMMNPLELSGPMIEFIEGENVLSKFDSSLFLPKFHHLTCLLLERVEIGTRLFQDFSAIFPCLEDLTVRRCYGCLIYKISSNSLKYINLADSKKLMLLLDVPNICMFKFSGSNIPSLSLLGPSRQWDCDLALASWTTIDASWFIELKKFVKELRFSKISLSIDLFRGKILGGLSCIEDYPVPVVDNLIVTAHTSEPVCSALLSQLCWSVQPNTVTCCLYPTSYKNLQGTSGMTPQLSYYKANNDLMVLLCKKLKCIQQFTDPNSTEERIGGNVVKRVAAEIYEDSVKKWHNLPWLKFLELLHMSEKENKIRIRLTWGPLEHAGIHNGLI